jgi:AbrB family looped-hinge helix DNA binding protein
MEEAIMTSKGQIVVPARLRKRYGLKPGMKVLFIEKNHEILFQPVTREYIRSVRGMLSSNASVTGELLVDQAKDREQEEAKIGKRRTQCP